MWSCQMQLWRNKVRKFDRIIPILEIIERVWVNQPDTRLGQLLLNIADKDDLFYIEDDELLIRLKRKLSRSV